GEEPRPRDDSGADDAVLDDASGAGDHVVTGDRGRDRRVRPDPDVLAEARGGEEDRVRPDLTSGADRERALEVGAGPDRAAVPDRDATADRDPGLNRPRADL